MALAILRFGELWLKSEGVKKRFLLKLVSNIKALLGYNGIDYELKLARTRIFVNVADYEKAAKVFNRVFGLSSFSFAVEVLTDKQEMVTEVTKIASNFKKKDTFAIRVKREGKHKFTSQQLAAELGSAVVEKYGNKVDLSNPKKTIYVEVLGDKSYIFDEKINCAGGLPVGVEGSAVAYLEDDFYSVAAAYMIMKRGCKIIPVLKKGISDVKIKKILLKYDPKFEIKYVVEENEKYNKIGAIARKTYSKAVVLGETFDKIKFDDQKVELPVFRPLIGFDGEVIDELFNKLK
ncbi:MAG: hypothetical protein KAI53_03450 [Candidatus Aenigmarchaeota archaeon]|nr:hypothetical protein [Candidatus Aenigmarchaeota archaeon]